MSSTPERRPGQLGRAAGHLPAPLPGRGGSDLLQDAAEGAAGRLGVARGAGRRAGWGGGGGRYPGTRAHFQRFRGPHPAGGQQPVTPGTPGKQRSGPEAKGWAAGRGSGGAQKQKCRAGKGSSWVGLLGALPLYWPLRTLQFCLWTASLKGLLGIRRWVLCVYGRCI